MSILAGRKRFSCSAFVVVVLECTDTPILLNLQIFRENAQAVAHDFYRSVHQHCISGLRLGNSRNISIRLSVQRWMLH